MKRDTANRMLSLIIDNEHLKLHKKCLTEIRKLVFGTGQERLFINKLTKRINILLREGYRAIGTSGFEKLKHSSDLYSMHVDTQSLNIRILFAIMDNNVQLLLLAFSEKAGKKDTDYSYKIPEAQRRMKEFTI